ncbi:hypothetical protein [Ancylomarina sp. 16SWW S1-10-2]|uniref:hypothetical protein n=1 Tax=Ancylomarina sp. 16SWW S1-10-2 TaxID=2499681 RepID=UPI0012AE1B13|nr:hypothetical protein [Ancylomarina sp. 16SWW S1-10-2]MRT92585.1 hypothetical protein [Ancylomarina sp. 16SWW S1-10-2]
MKEINEIADWINEFSNEIIGNIDQESIDVFNFLKTEYLKSDITKNFLFQFVYRSFFRLDNAGLTPEFKTEYFELLEKNRNKKQFDFEKNVKRLFDFPNRKGQNTLQFSFTSKMFNMIDNVMPIYDSEVAKMFGFSRPYNPEFEKKLEKYLHQFDIISKGYSEIKKERLLTGTIELFDRKFKDNNLSEMKKIDFIFWSAGKIQNRIDKVKNNEFHTKV